MARGGGRRQSKGRKGDGHGKKLMEAATGKPQKSSSSPGTYLFKARRGTPGIRQDVPTFGGGGRVEELEIY